MTDHLDLGLVLVRPEVRDGRVGLGLLGPGEESAGGGDASFGGVRPVLDAHVGLEQRVVPAGHITCRDDAGGGVAGRVADHAVVELEA